MGALFVDLMLFALAGLLAVPAATLLIQALSAVLLPDKGRLPTGARTQVAVLVPAHDECSTIGDTVSGAKQQLRAQDRIIVIADNCSDDTASIARAAGAEVVVRNDIERRGKGFALDAGIRHLAATMIPDAVIILDADCSLGPRAVELLACASSEHDAPVQCLNLMKKSAPDTTGTNLAEFAWRIKNDLRPTGFARLGLPCQLMGTGMALPWRLVSGKNLGTGHITEDLVFGLSLALDGHPPVFCRSAIVMSDFPVRMEAKEQQKARWVHGYLTVLRQDLLRLIRAAIVKRDFSLFATACDLTILPLAALASISLGLTTVAAVWFIWSGSNGPLIVVIIDFGAFVASAALAWYYCGRDLIGVRELADVPRHMLLVVKIVFRFLRGRRSSWVRAERSK
jgi:glycosyltransferase involved in cell wall biosynthesis